MKNFKGFIAGVLTTLLVMLLVTTVFAAEISRTLTAVYRDIKITIDGKQIVPKDASGNVVEPFIVDGTTYLPVRAIAGVVGYDVSWDGNTNTVILSSGAADTAPIIPTLPTPTQQGVHTFSGTGNTVINDINLSAGNYYARSTHDGSSNFIVYFYYGERNFDRTLIANEIGKSSGERLLNNTLGVAVPNGILEIRADGDWTITLHEVSGTITSPVAGTGDTVTGMISGFSGRRTITVTHNGRSNIIVRMYSYSGESRSQLITNEIGIYTGESTVNFSSNERYYFEVRADGDWTITID